MNELDTQTTLFDLAPLEPAPTANRGPIERSAQALAAVTQRKLGQYPTPRWAAEALIRRYFPYLSHRDLVIEPSCGPGVFLEALPAYVPAIGVEIDPELAALAQKRTGRRVVQGDFRTVPLKLDMAVRLILGNPPFDLDMIDGFLIRGYELLTLSGQMALIVPAYMFQTAKRVVRYAQSWSIQQEFIPRNIFEGLSLPLVFAIFTKELARKLVGFALYREAADVQELPDEYRELMTSGSGPIWKRIVLLALKRLGGKANLQQLYGEIEGHRPTLTKFWREKIRQTVRRYQQDIQSLNGGFYALAT